MYIHMHIYIYIYIYIYMCSHLILITKSHLRVAPRDRLASQALVIRRNLQSAVCCGVLQCMAVCCGVLQ